MKKDPLLPLKLLVYGMGIMLVGGFFYLAYTLMSKASELTTKSCDSITLAAEAPVGATLKSSRFEGNYWVITYKQKNGGQILLRYEPCGKLVQKVTVK
jgi:hypothetical protein